MPTTTTLYEIAVTIPGHLVDGRNHSAAWGHESQYHASRESADLACHRLIRGSAAHGLPAEVTFHVEERTRDHFADDEFGDQEWRYACRQAGVDPYAEDA